MENLLILLVLATAVWVYFDAQSIGVQKGQMPGLFDASPALWAVGCVVLWVVIFPLYLVKRAEYKRINGKL